METLFLNGRKVVDIEVEVDSFRGFDDFDAWFSSARFEDNGTLLSDDELELLSDTYDEVIADRAYENRVSIADFMD